MRASRRLLAWSAVVLSAAAPLRADDTKAADPAAIEFFEKKVRPVLAERCFTCHSTTAKRKRGGLILDSRAAGAAPGRVSAGGACGAGGRAVGRHRARAQARSRSPGALGLKAIQVTFQGRHRLWLVGPVMFQAAQHESIHFARQCCPVDPFATRSKRSRFITLAHTATKSRTNASCESSHA
jgi:hypothetical protein